MEKNDKPIKKTAFGVIEKLPAKDALKYLAKNVCNKNLKITNKEFRKLYKELSKKLKYNIAIKLGDEGKKELNFFTNKNSEFKNRGISVTIKQKEITLFFTFLDQLDVITKNTNNKFQLDIRNCKIRSSEVDKLCETIKESKTITKINVSGISVDYNKMEDLFNAIKVNNSITVVNFSNNNIGYAGCIGYDGKGMSYDLISVNKKIKKLNLSHNQIDGHGSENLLINLKYNKTLTSVDLSNNMMGFGSDINEKLYDLIKENKTIKELDLSYNHIESKTASGIILSLKYNEVIEKINLSGNNIDEDLIRSINMLVKKNKINKLNL